MGSHGDRLSSTAVAGCSKFSCGQLWCSSGSICGLLRSAAVFRHPSEWVITNSRPKCFW